MDPAVKEWMFESAERSPGTWLVRAHQLRGAAKRLDWIVAPVTDSEPLSFIAEYRLLMGLSFENLLKGIIVAQRLRQGRNEPLKGILHHKLAKLLPEVDQSVFPLSAKEAELLEQLVPYIEWAGRYPLPKRAHEYMVRGHSSDEYRRELLLWERMFEYLKGIAWVSKGRPDEEGWFFLLTR